MTLSPEFFKPFSECAWVHQGSTVLGIPFSIDETQATDWIVHDPNKFDDLYPDGRDRCIDGDCIARFDDPHPCVVCGTMTRWMSVSFHAHFCDRDCLETWWNDFYEASVRKDAS